MSFVLAKTKVGNKLDVPARALLIISAASTNLVIRAALGTKGYTSQIHQQFWSLLHELCGHRGSPVELTDVVSAAVDEVDKWDEPNFRLIHAVLHHEFPEQEAFLFENLEPSTGSAAVFGVATLLDRIDELENGKERKETRKADRAAVDKLAHRGVPAAERARIRGLVDIARSALDGGAPPPSPGALARLTAMVEEWTEIARIVLTRRADLVQIGAIKRKKPASNKAKKGEVVVAPPVQVVAAPLLALPPAAPPQPPSVVASEAPPQPPSVLASDASPQPPSVVAHESAPVTTSTPPA